MVQSSAAAPLRIGSRGSPLALVQARTLQSMLTARLKQDSELVVIKTSGDVIQDRPLTEEGGKGLFTKEIEEALLEGLIDLAVHSAKDMPTFSQPGLMLAACLEREDPRDVFISRKAKSLAELPKGATLGTASLRRQAIAMRLRPDLKVVPLRGNVETRLRKLDAGEADATLLAVAGLKRLGLLEKAAAIIDSGEILPAVGQGAIGIEIRAADARLRALLAPLDDRATTLCVTAERVCLAELDGSCHTPIAAYAELSADGRDLHLRSLIALPDGTAVHRDERAGSAGDSVALGRAAGRHLKAAAAPAFFRMATA
jgi:hydroxymethylbilane synthase